MPLLSSVRGRIIAGFGLLIIILVVGAFVSTWTARHHRSDMAEMESRAEIANLLEDAAFNATLANLLLERYLVTGDTEVVPVIRSSIAQASDNIAQGHTLEVAQGREYGDSGSDDAELARFEELAAGVAGLSETFELVLALRQSGDEEGARQALETAIPDITVFGIGIGEAAQLERGEIPALRSHADSTADLAFWFTVAAGAAGTVMGLAAAAFIARSILKPLSTVEAAALAVADGDLDARADTTGPRELAHLGESLNRMTESLLDASKRRELEEARDRAFDRLRESEERYRDLVENANDIVYSHDLEGHFTSVNGASERIMGYPPEEMVKMDIAQILAPEHLELARQMIRRKVEGGDRTTYELAIIAKDGHRVPLEVSTRLIWRSGKLVGVQGIARDISDRKRAEEALRQRTHDLGERVKELNCLYGITQLVDKPDVSLEDIVQGTADLIPPSWQYPEVTCARIILEGREFRTKNFRQSTWIQTADIAVNGEPAGSVDVCYLKEQPASDEGPFLKEERNLINAIARQLAEVIERKRAEEALRKSQERTRQIVETAQDAFITMDTGGVITAWNGAAESIFGWPRQEALGRTLTDTIIPPRLRAAHEGGLKRFLATGEGPVLNKRIEITAVHRDGHEFPVELAVWAVESRDTYTFNAFVHDISERKRAEQALRESEEKFRGLLESAPDAIVIVNGDGRIVLVNAQTEETLGYKRDELLGQPVEMLVPERFRKTHAGHRAGYHSEPHTRRMDSGHELIARRKDRSEFPVAVSLSPQETKDGVLVTSIIRDISERKRAEEELQRLNQELEADQQAIEELNRSLEERVRQRTDELRLANEELRQRNRQLLDARAQAATDGLTGLSNHRAFHERIQVEVQRARETGSSVGLVMLDIDGFKRVNDSLGHLAGDEILRGLADTLASVVGHEDAYRYGGDEFAVLMPGADCRETARVAERLRRAVAKRMDGSGPGVTVSLGIACFPDTAESAEELIYGADAAMYWAKSAGKNRVGDWGKLIKHREEGTLPWYLTDSAVKTPDVVAALVAALAAKDPVTAAHTERCSWYTLSLAEELGLDEQETSVIRLAALLHDIGKLAVPDEVLCKPGPLTDEEWVQMKQHPTAALHVLAQIRSIADATPAILHHHEHFNGSGYPDGLAGDDIPIASRILLVTDAFDAMTTDRPYRKAIPVEAAVDELQRHSGTQFDPAVVDAFLRVLSRQGAEPLGHKADNHEGPIELKRPARKSRTRATTRQRRRAGAASPSVSRSN